MEIVSVSGNVECCNLRSGSLEGRRAGAMVNRCRWQVGYGCDCDCFSGLVSGFSSANRVVWVSNLNHLVKYVYVWKAVQRPCCEFAFCSLTLKEWLISTSLRLSHSQYYFFW